jgi:gamma-glutamyltranspeptidase/glutathione hydrolase
VFIGTGNAALDEWARVFTFGGRTPDAGEIWRSPVHAGTLRRLASEGPRDFYEGALAARIAEHARATGGLIDGDDLAGFRSEWVEPISIAYRDHEVWEIPPNGQGIAALQALGIVEGTAMRESPHASAGSWHWQIEAMKLAFADTYRYVADPRRADVPIGGMLDAGYLASRRALMGERAQSRGPGQPPGGGTVYLCAADRDGMMVSYIQSNYMGFGSGVVVPGTGIALQNRAAGFTLEPGHRNEAAGGKRPRHTIIPGFLTRGGAPVGPFGVMGGEMQPQGHLQVVTSMVDYGLDPQSALDAPRWRVTPDEVVLEPVVGGEVADGLRGRGHRVAIAPSRLDFGRGQIIRRLDSGVYAGGTEPRTDGVVAAW